MVNEEGADQRDVELSVKLSVKMPESTISAVCYSYCADEVSSRIIVRV